MKNSKPSSIISKNHHRVEPKIRPIVPINHHDYRIAFLFQAIFTAMVVMVALMLKDLLDHLFSLYNKESTDKWYFKYIIYSSFFLSYFVSTLVCIYFLLWLFGYGICFMPPHPHHSSSLHP